MIERDGWDALSIGRNSDDTEGSEFEGEGAFDGPEDDDPSRRARTLEKPAELSSPYVVCKISV